MTKRIFLLLLGMVILMGCAGGPRGYIAPGKMLYHTSDQRLCVNYSATGDAKIERELRKRDLFTSHE